MSESFYIKYITEEGGNSCFHCARYLCCKKRIEESNELIHILELLDKPISTNLYTANILASFGCMEYKSILLDK